MNPDEKILIFVGRPAAYKGIEATLKALNQIKYRHKIRCVFCGNMEGFGKFSEQLLPVAPIVIFTGQLTKNELSKWYKAADIGLMPSYSEQFGYSAIEMINYGLPLVVSDGNGLCDMFIDGQDAYVARIGNVTDVNEFAQNLAMKIDQMLSLKPKTIEKNDKHSTRESSKKYSANIMVDGYVRLCRKIVDIQLTQ